MTFKEFEQRCKIKIRRRFNEFLKILIYKVLEKIINQRRKNQIKNIYRDWETDRKSTRLNSSHRSLSRMPSSA